jgi:hypothetical protein
MTTPKGDIMADPKRKKKSLKKIGLSAVTIFRIVNRKGYAAVAKGNLTEGRTVYQAYSRLVKACRRGGYELPIRKAPDLPKPR